MAKTLWAVLTVKDSLPPLLIIQVPLNRFAYAALKGFLGSPTEFTLDLARIDGVTKIMPRPILDERNQLAITLDTDRLVGRQFFEQITQGFHNLEIGFLVMAADVVGFADLAPTHNLA